MEYKTESDGNIIKYMAKYNFFSMQSLFKSETVVIEPEMQSQKKVCIVPTVDLEAITIITLFWSIFLSFFA